MPLLRGFRTSSSQRTSIEHVLVQVKCGDFEGWGECAAPHDPYYCAETAGTCWLILKDFLVPAVLGYSWSHLEELVARFARVKGNNFAKAGLEMAAVDAWAQSQGVPVSKLLCGTRAHVTSGVSLGIEDSLASLFDQITQYHDEGYKRVKLKIAPGRDVDVVRAVRDRFPSLPLQVDANSAYTTNDIDIMRKLDECELLLIEQPLAHDDIIDHAWLQRQLKTPICLDESLRSFDDVRKALDIGACRVVNIKCGRVGGLLESKRIHDLCVARGVPVWCGGMHEFGIGRAANLALCSLAGFTLPGDVSGSDKYYQEDLVEPPIVAEHGTLVVPQAVGLGHRPVLRRVERWTTEEWTVTV